MVDIDVQRITNKAKTKGFKVQNQGDLGLSMSTDTTYVSFLKRGSAIVVGTKDEGAAVLLYKTLLSA